jgi:hypothetical protein
MAPAPKDKKAPPYLKSGDAGNDQKEEYKNAFNDPENKVKIIIGSDTIKEGVNLNGNTIQTYPCVLDWNPTGTQQLIGRSHRQGNKQGRVHITFPLMNDSVDSFMYQKHDEKKSRLDTLWKSKDAKMEIDEINPEELKFSLIKDPKKRASLIIQEKTAELRQQGKIAESTSSKIVTMAKERKVYVGEIGDSQSEVEKMKKAITLFNAKTDAEIIKEYGLDFAVSWKSSIYDSYGQASGKNIDEVRKNYIESVKTNIADDQKKIARNKGKIETIDNTLKRYAITEPDNSSAVERISKRYASEAEHYKTQIETIEANRAQYIKEAEEQIKQEKRPGISVKEAVEKNAKVVSENLYGMHVVKERVNAQKQAGEKKMILRMKRPA